ncbi:MAG TPA: TIGR02757 family protein [bacterium]|nr:TIGR02757 family protein [bacterium]
MSDEPSSEYILKYDIDSLELLYKQLNKPRFIHPDPLECILKFEDVREREIAGVIAASLAYGRVTQIISNIYHVLNVMGDSPLEFVMSNTESRIKKKFKSFKYRFTTGDDLASFLAGVGRAVREYGTLENCFVQHFDPADETVIPALCGFVGSISGTEKCCYLTPTPDRGSACKRMNLFLRWMVRRDEVDPGGWESVPASKLVVPLDIHMHRISKKLGITTRNQADLKTALEITAAFKKIQPGDPVKYDFALSRTGILKLPSI